MNIHEYPLISRNNGQILVEIILVVLLLVFVTAAIAQSIVSSTREVAIATGKTTATFISQEAIEAMRAITLENWQNIATLATGSANIFSTVISAGKWATTTASENINLNDIVYNRYFWLDDVLRSSTGTIVTSGGAWDPSTKKVNTMVTWTPPLQGSSSTFSQVAYLSRFFNEIYPQTDWSGGSIGEVVVIAATTTFATSTSINYASTTGSITLQEQ